MLVEKVEIDGVYVADGMRYAAYNTSTTSIKQNGTLTRIATEGSTFIFKSRTQPLRAGVMLVGLGGSNGSTFLAGILANKRTLSWREKTGMKTANLLGSVVANGCTSIGAIRSPDGSSITSLYAPLKSLAPFPNPIDLYVSGWDICAKNLYEAQQGACVLQPELLDQLRTDLEKYKPYPGASYGTWLASTQVERSDNLMPITSTTTYRDIVNLIRSNIREFKCSHGLDDSKGQAHTTVLWTASTERYCDESLIAMHLMTKDQLLKELTHVVNDLASEYLAPSLLYAVAAIEEGCSYLNGAPQNTLVPGLQQYARFLNCLLAGNDFKTGQTKFKSFLTDMLVSTGLRVRAITSYNHLGNNDGYNLSEEKQFKSKEISKTEVIDDIINKAPLLYSRNDQGELQPSVDHTVVIKYIPYVRDSKRALDEYVSDIFMNGISTISVYNMCEDTLLAVPIMIDIVCFAVLLSSVEVAQFQNPHGYLSKVTKDIVANLEFKPIVNLMPVMSLFFKAPISRTVDKSDVVNAFAAQRAAIEDFIRALAGLQSLPVITPSELIN